MIRRPVNRSVSIVHERPEFQRESEFARASLREVLTPRGTHAHAYRTMTKTKGREALRRLTERRGGDTPLWTQGAIARAMGISQPSVSGWVSGQTRPGPEYRAALESLLGIARDEWLTSREAAVVARARGAALARSA